MINNTLLALTKSDNNLINDQLQASQEVISDTPHAIAATALLATNYDIFMKLVDISQTDTFETNIHSDDSCTPNPSKRCQIKQAPKHNNKCVPRINSCLHPITTTNCELIANLN